MGAITHHRHGHLSIKEADLPRWLHDHHLRGLKRSFAERKLERDADGVVREHDHLVLVTDPKMEPRIIANSKAAHNEDVASGVGLLVLL